jgi:DNA (cytosine-5)-methyltransferase 1
MSHQLLVRNVPEEVRQWIRDEVGRRRLTQQEFVLSVLRKAAGRRAPQGHTPRRPAPPSGPATLPFTFIDLFAGIGGFRIALERLGGQAIASCEWDRYAQRTYAAWFGETPRGDIRQIDPETLPDHDLLAAGFPCQPFSIAGVSKKKSLGYAHGFQCEAQGTLFFSLAAIIEAKRPPVLLLENVKNLMSHDGGRTWKVIRGTLESLDYRVFARVLDAAGWVPQHRERIFIVGFDRRVFGDEPPFEFPEPPDGRKPLLRDILESHPDGKYTLSAHLWGYLQEYAEKHKAQGNGFGFGIADRNGTTRTLSARYYKDGSEILIRNGNGGPPRRLTPGECARLMGFDPDVYPIVVSDTQAYRQFGNAVVPPVAEAVGRSILKAMTWQLTRPDNRCLIKSSASLGPPNARIA